MGVLKKNLNQPDRWIKELNQSIRTYEELIQFLGKENIQNSPHAYILTKEYKETFEELQKSFKFQTTKYYIKLANIQNPYCPILLQILPQKKEIDDFHFIENDPLNEEINSPIQNLVHKYPDRVLWYLHHNCAVYCRFCMRKRKVSKPDGFPFQKQFDDVLNYIQKNENIKEVILSGGDPLTLSDLHLDKILFELKKIHHLFSIRIHTRILTTLPSRITKNLCKILKKYYPITIVTHFNHPVELTPVVFNKIKMLRMSGVLILNQSVLLKNINDNVETMENLLLKLIKFGIKPYYLHHCDEVKGTSHFRTKLQTGIEILKSIQGRNPGITIPHYMVDLPKGGGKVPIQFSYMTNQNDNLIEIYNYNLKKYFIKDF